MTNINLCGAKRNESSLIDMRAVEDRLAGDRSRVLTVAERMRCIDLLDDGFRTIPEVAARMGVCTRTVERRRRERREAGQA
jgi:hypothetical protein